MNWTKKNKRTVIIASIITIILIIWLWGFTHQTPPLNRPEAQQEPPPETRTEPERPEESRYLPSAEDAKPEKPEERQPKDVPSPEGAPEEEENKEEKDVLPEEKEDVEEPGWKDPEWPEWPEWSERRTTPLRTVTGTVGSVQRRDGQ